MPVGVLVSLIPITDANLILVFLVYGLALFVVGLSTALESRRTGDQSTLGANLWALSGFGFLHGFSEWAQMLQIVARHGIPIPARDYLAPASSVLMFASFILLLYFGIALLAGRERRYMYLLLPVLISLWLGLSVWLSVTMEVTQGDWAAHANGCGRYFLYFPGAVLAAVALTQQGRLFRQAGLLGVGRNYGMAGWAFLVSAVTSGLIVPQADFFPASVLNYATFASVTGLPIAVPRAVLGLVVAYSVLAAIRALDSERRRRLLLANDRLQRLSLQVLSAQEEERKRISRELHDETIQLLSLLLVRLELKRRESDSAERAKPLDDAMQLALQAANGLRRIARDLRPPAIDDLGLVAALEWYTRGLQESHGLEIDFKVDGIVERPAPAVELALYRIAQEALTNALKHSGTRSARIRLQRTDEFISALVEDDGRGFDLDEVRASRGSGLGLFGMEERALVLGAQLSIVSRPGFGTRIRVDVPLEAAYA